MIEKIHNIAHKPVFNNASIHIFSFFNFYFVAVSWINAFYNVSQASQRKSRMSHVCVCAAQQVCKPVTRIFSRSTHFAKENELEVLKFIFLYGSRNRKRICKICAWMNLFKHIYKVIKNVIALKLSDHKFLLLHSILFAL